MKDADVFVDTNILVYAYDISAGEKHARAAAIIRDLWKSGRGIISTQVLQEFFVTVTKKIAKPLDSSAAKQILKDYLAWKTIVVNGGLILEAVDILIEHRYSFWDSVIIVSAIEGGAGILLSEDLSDRQKIKTLAIKNPFS
jgi:predicted nucleic acid-binding protein